MPFKVFKAFSKHSEAIVLDDKGQAAVEYILLVALGLFLMIIAFTLAFYVKQFTDVTLSDIAATRNETISMLFG